MATAKDLEKNLHKIADLLLSLIEALRDKKIDEKEVKLLTHKAYNLLVDLNLDKHEHRKLHK